MKNQNQTLMGVLAYLGLLVIIPIIAAKDDPFVKFHVRQGIVLVIIEFVLWLAMSVFWPLVPIAGLLQLGVLILIIIGIINVLQQREKELPVVGSFAKNIKI